MVIKETAKIIDGCRKAGYAFKIRTMSTGYTDLFCYSDKRTCKTYYNRFEDILNYYDNAENTEEDPETLGYKYEDEIQDAYEVAQRYCSDFYNEISQRDIEYYNDTEVYLDKFADKYYIIINEIAPDI